MSKTYDNSGILYKNDRKEKEKHPDYKGQVTIGGTAYWLSGWIKKGDKGPFISLAFEKKDGDRSERREEPRRDRGTIDDMESNIPF